MPRPSISARGRSSNRWKGTWRANVRPGTPSPGRSHRLRAGTLPGAPPPTLTLEPSTTRAATPPEETVQAVAPDQVVLMRFGLPPKAVQDSHAYQVTARDWSSGQVRWVRAGLSAEKGERSSFLAVNITGDMLPPGSYEFLVSLAGSEAASYELTVGPTQVARGFMRSASASLTRL